MITEYPLDHRRYGQSEYEPFWAAAAALDMPLSLHTATRRQGKIRGAGDKTLRDASSRATKAFYPALSLCDMIFSGVFERHPRLTLAIVEFELAWAPHLLSTMDYTYRERHAEAIYRFKFTFPGCTEFVGWGPASLAEAQPLLPTGYVMVGLPAAHAVRNVPLPKTSEEAIIVLQPTRNRGVSE
jgi:predicted TIM-barrel fold metal-dependent hydrolase